MENGIQPMLPVSLPRAGEEGDSNKQNDKIAQAENAITQNFSILYAQLEAVVDYLSGGN